MVEGTLHQDAAPLRSQGATASGSDGSSLEASLKVKPCRIHLVGVLATSDGASEVHLGPWTAPASADQDPPLLDFATAIKKLIRIAAGQDTWWRFEYMCYGNPVPILSDEALCEAFNYFRDQNQTLNPAEAAAACRLYLWPTSKQPPWTVTDYLAEPRLGLNKPLNPVSSLNPGSQVSGDRLQGPGYRPVPLQLSPQNLVQYHNHNHHSNNISCSEGGSDPASSAGEGPAAATDGPASTALGAADGGASSSSSHEAPQQQQLTDTGLNSPENSSWPHPPVAAAAAAAVNGVKLPRILLAPADQTSHSRRNGQQQQQQRVIKRGASGNMDPAAESTWASTAPVQQQQQKQQEPNMLSAAGELSIPSKQQQQHADGDGRGSDARSSKAAKRDSDSSPRSQWLHEQQQQQQFFQQQQVADQAGAGTALLPSAFAAVSQRTPSLGPTDSAAAAAMAAAFLQQQQQQQVSGLGLPPHMRQAVSVTAANGSGRVDSEGGAMGPGLSGSFASLDQLQQLHLSSSNLGNLAGNSSNLPARANSITSAGNLGILGQQQQQQQGMWANLNAQQQQQLNRVIGSDQIDPRFQPTKLPEVLNSQNIGQLPAGQFLFPQATAADLLPGSQLGSSSLAVSSSADLAAMSSRTAAEVAAAAGGSRVSSAGAVDSNLAGLQLSVAASRVKSETKTKYADGRFKDEARHQQRLSDMKARCDALFGGAIQNHFQIEHHKRVTCLVCNSTVVPYEAYHIDAVRKHFVRHHETWLVEAGVDVDLWRKSCAPIARGAVAAAARGAAAAAATSSKTNGAAGAEDAAAEDDGASGRKGSSTRLADGRYKDPQQHQQRLLDMQARCAALFNGTMTQHWTINNHKSISCHLCQQNITPYAAYHPDCLRKHFVRRHEDMLVAAGVDVAAWSKGIPVGRRKLKALLQQQQQQQPQLLLQGSGQLPLLLPENSQQQQQGLLLPVHNQPQLWSWLNAQQQQVQQQQPDGLEAGPAVPQVTAAGNEHFFLGLQQQQQQSGGVLPPNVGYSPAQQQQQQQQLVSGLSSALHQQQQVPVVQNPVANASASRTVVNPQGFGSPNIAPQQQQQQQQQQYLPQHPQPEQQQQVAAVGFEGPSAQQQVPHNATIQFAAHGPTSAAAPANAQQPLLAVNSAPAAVLSRLASTDTLPLDGLGLKRDAGDLNPTSLSDPNSQQGSAEAPKRMLGLLQQQQKQLQQQQSAAAGGKGGNTNPQYSATNPQQQRTTADWARSMSDVPGFGPMSLSPAMGLAGLANSLNGGLPGSLMDINMGGVGSLTEADVAAMWDDDDDDVGHLDDSALADELLKQASHWAVQQS